jgi:hypothetical protein
MKKSPSVPPEQSIGINLLWLDLANFRKEMIKVSGEWDGDTPVGEDKAHIAHEIAEKCGELMDLLKGLDEN